MPLRKSIAIALLVTLSLMGLSIANASDRDLEYAAAVFGLSSSAPAAQQYDASNKISRGDATAILGFSSTPRVVQSQRYIPVQRTVKVQPRSHAAQLRHQRLLNKRRLENQQRVRNQQRRLNHRRQLVNKANSQRNYGYRNLGRRTGLAGNSIWHRVRNGFRFRNETYRPAVQRAIRQYKNHPARLSRALNRSTDYLHYVITELERRRMPLDLVLLPMVESAYVNKARSHAGAVGLWQFIPETGRRYGLKQTRGFDGRMDVMESTRAAMDYLQFLHREFRGDWLLALAAYNCGENRVRREVAKNKARGLRTDYWSLSLPAETKYYIPKLLAYREVIRSPYSFGIHLPHAINTPQLVQINVRKAVDLKQLARDAGVHPSTVTRLNPSYKYGITMPSLSRRIVLPRRHAGTLQRAILYAPAVHPSRLVRYARVNKKKTL